MWRSLALREIVFLERSVPARKQRIPPWNAGGEEDKKERNRCTVFFDEESARRAILLLGFGRCNSFYPPNNKKKCSIRDTKGLGLTAGCFHVIQKPPEFGLELDYKRLKFRFNPTPTTVRQLTFTRLHLDLSPSRQGAAYIRMQAFNAHSFSSMCLTFQFNLIFKAVFFGAA